MQQLWGKILAGEVSEPGSISLKTMDVIRGVSGKNAEVFLRLASRCLLLTKRAVMIMEKRTLEALGFTFEELLDLAELGLVTEEKSSVELEMHGGSAVLSIDVGHCYLFESKDGMPGKMTISVRPLTRAGTDLCRVVRAKPDLSFFESTAGVIAERSKIRVTFGAIETRPDGTAWLLDATKKVFE